MQDGLALPEYQSSPLFNDRERLSLEYADRITITDQDVTDEFFGRLTQSFSNDEIVELTATIAWENCSSKFNRALRIDSQELWSCKTKGGQNVDRGDVENTGSSRIE